MTGDAVGARRAFESLAPFSRRPSGDFRSALLAAYVEMKSGEGEHRESVMDEDED